MTVQEACAQAFENGRRQGDAEGYARGKAEAARHEGCGWCKPGDELCGTCSRFFDNECPTMPDDDRCAVYEPIDCCPKCGRKLRNDDGKA
jgi:hypothetical protein